MLFMGDEFGSTSEWNYKTELPWELLQYESHRGMKACVAALCHLLKNEPAMYEKQFEAGGFEWVDLNHRAESVVVYRRKGLKPEDDLLVVLNMTPEVRRDWKLRTYGKDNWKEIFNSNNSEFWGTGDVFNPGPVVTMVDEENDLYEINLHLPPLAALVLK